MWFGFNWPCHPSRHFSNRRIARDSSLCRCCCYRRWYRWDWWLKLEVVWRSPIPKSAGSWLGIFLCMQICLYLRSSDYQREGILGLLYSCRIFSSGVTVENLRAQNNFLGCWLSRSIGMIIVSCWNLPRLLEPILLNFMDCRDRKMDHSTRNQGSMVQLQMGEARSQQQLFYLAEIENWYPGPVKWE